MQNKALAWLAALVVVIAAAIFTAANLCCGFGFYVACGLSAVLVLLGAAWPYSLFKGKTIRLLRLIRVWVWLLVAGCFLGVYSYASHPSLNFSVEVYLLMSAGALLDCSNVK